jgi:hypothetical protein
MHAFEYNLINNFAERPQLIKYFCNHIFVAIPAKAGIQRKTKNLDSASSAE